MNTETQVKEPLLPYYVYILLDPLNGNSPFYVGKGTGNRANYHLLEIQKKIRLEVETIGIQTELLTKKQKTIKDIIDSGKHPIVVIVGRYETEDEAYAVEASLIHFVFGYNNLTNLAYGHGSRLLRTLEEFEYIRLNVQSQEQIPAKPGVDIEEIVGIRDGSFKNAKIKGLTEENAYEFLEQLKADLSLEGFEWRAFSLPGDMKFHPGESNGYLAVLVRINSVDFNIQFTKKKSISIQVVYTESTKTKIAIDFLNKMTNQLNISIGPINVGDKYSWLLPRKQFDEIEELIEFLNSIRNLE